MNKQKESLYRQCAAAVERIIHDRDGRVFTEIDVLMEAADPKQWKMDTYTEALHPANAICGTQYRNRKLSRFGPIILSDGSEDFARIDGKIVYADAATGPEAWETPNGPIPRLMIEDDTVGKQGRRAGTGRNDELPWEGQASTVRPKRIRRRKASTGSVVDLKKENDELRQEVERLRALQTA
jgi:hypothetical protein